jgi:hypothetical protein
MRLQAARAKRDGRRVEARDVAWTRLSRLLRLDVVSPADKRRAALAFLRVYGYDRDRNPYVDALVPHAFAGVPPGPWRRPTDAALALSVGRLLRVGTPDGDVQGFLRGFDGATALVEADGRYVPLDADRIRTVAILSSW